MRISAINLDYLKINERKNFLSGKEVSFLQGKIRMATQEELNEFIQFRPHQLKDNFYFAVWIKNKKEGKNVCSKI